MQAPEQPVVDPVVARVQRIDSTDPARPVEPLSAVRGSQESGIIPGGEVQGRARRQRVRQNLRLRMVWHRQVPGSQLD